MPRSSLGVTTHAAASTAAGIADLAAALGLVGAGLLVWLLRPGTSFGLHIVSLAGLAWFAPDWVGWEAGPAVARSVAMVVEPFFLAFVTHLVIATPGGRALFRDPFLDPYCWSNCRDNVLLVSAQPGIAAALDEAWILVSFAVGGVLAGWATARIASATPAARRAIWPILSPGSLVGAVPTPEAMTSSRRS